MEELERRLVREQKNLNVDRTERWQDGAALRALSVVGSASQVSMQLQQVSFRKGRACNFRGRKVIDKGAVVIAEVIINT